jgi:hypothetical protein
MTVHKRKTDKLGFIRLKASYSVKCLVTRMRRQAPERKQTNNNIYLESEKIHKRTCFTEEDMQMETSM